MSTNGIDNGLSLRRILIAGAAGAVLAVGGVMAADALTGTADAQSSNQVTQAELDAANLRSQRAIKQATEAWNKVAKYLADPGELIRANGPRVSQQAGVGGGLPTGLFADAAITTPKIADGAVTRAKLASTERFRWITKTTNAANAVGRTSDPAYSLQRINAGNYRAVFDFPVTACSWTTSPTVDGPGLPAAVSTRAAIDTTDPTRILVQTFNQGGNLLESGWTLQLMC
jgi:hypothetical protein